MTVYQPVPFVPHSAIIGKTYLAQVADNDRVLRARLDGRRTWPYTEAGRWIAQETSLVIWDGWHYLDKTREDTLYYHFGCRSDSPSHPSSLRMFYDGAQVAMATGNQSYTVWAEGQYDLSGKSSGLYRVYFELIRNQEDNWYNATGYAVPPYSGYAGDFTYDNGLAEFRDGFAANAGDFDCLRNNDIFFKDKLCPYPAGQALYGIVAGSSTSKGTQIWQAFYIHESEVRTIEYRIGMKTENPDYADSKAQIVWDQLGYNVVIASHETTTPGTFQWFSGSATIPSSAVPGQWYGISTRIYRDNPSEGTTIGSTEYVYLRRTNPMPFWDPGEYQVGQVVYGNTGYPTDLNKLAINDSLINDRLIYRNWAVMRNACPTTLGGPYGVWEYYFTRRGDALVYRGRGGKLEYAAFKKETALEDAGTDENPEVYRVVDLNSVIGLHYGMTYHVSGTGVEFAIEV